MSMSNIRSYFRTRVTALGLTEWKDGFNVDNIPATVIEKKPFHMEMGAFRGVKNNINHQEVEASVTVSFLVHGHRDPAAGIDTAISRAESIVVACVKPANAVTQTNIKNVFFRSLDLEPLAGSNDNVVRGKIGFDVAVIVSLA